MTLIFGLGLFLLSGLASLAYLVFFVFVLIDCAKNEPSEGNTKLTWVLIVILVQFIGPVVYYLVRRPERIATYGQ